jgi:uncharacterized membrane protein
LNLLSLFFLSMVPVIELRGAIPVGVHAGLPFWLVYTVSVAGNLVPVPFLIIFARRVLYWGATLPKIGRLCRRIIRFGKQKIRKIQRLNTALMLALFLFVAIPAPGTGAWTGSLAAALLQLPIKKSVLAISAGVMAAGIIMGVVSFGLFGFIRT